MDMHATHTYLFRPATMDFSFQEFYMQPCTYTSVFTDDHGLCVCVCVKYYLTMEIAPWSNHGLPPTQVHDWNFCLHAYISDLLQIGGSLTIVDVHGWCVSTVTYWFSDVCPWLKVLTNARTHTHTHVCTQKPSSLPRRTHKHSCLVCF